MGVPKAKLTGYRRALELAEELPKGTPVDQEVMGAWQKGDAVMAGSKLHDMLLLITGGEAQGIVQQVPGWGFEAWSFLNERFSSTGELYTFDKMNAIMKQTQVKHISAMPAAIAKFEKEGVQDSRDDTISGDPETADTYPNDPHVVEERV